MNKMNFAEQGRRLNTLFEDMEERLLYDPASPSHEEALQGAINWAFRDFSEDERADLYAYMVDGNVLNASLRMRFAVFAQTLSNWVQSRG